MAKPDKSRDERLAEALRANLRRRKAVSRKAKSDSPAELKGGTPDAKGAPDSADT